jgi:hypothetical protein
MARYTKKELNQFQDELEEILERKGYRVYRGKGKFRAGKCVVHQNRKIVINKLTPLKHRVNFLVELVREIDNSNPFYIKPAVREKLEKWSL